MTVVATSHKDAYVFGNNLKSKAKKGNELFGTSGRGGRVVRCRIAIPEVVSSNPGRSKINLQK